MHIAVFSGAGMSAESGLKTFRDNGGLWEEYDVYQVATPEAWAANPALVTRFYNERRKQLLEAEPNEAHRHIAALEQCHRVTVITQNIDDLHERAGSTEVMHLHGELMKLRSSVDENLVYPCTHWEVKMGDRCEKGSQLRPHVVWIGEMVPMIPQAAKVIAQCDLLLIIGTSLNVYPAAGLVHEARPSTPIYIIDPAELPLSGSRIRHFRQGASEGMRRVREELCPADQLDKTE